MRRYVAVGLAIVAALLVLTFVVRLSCGARPTKVEARADTVLAAVPAWQDTVRQRDSVIAVRDQERARLRRQSATQRLRADSAEALADSLQAWADGLAEVPTNLTPVEENAHLKVALAAQKQAAAQFQSTVIAYKAQRTTDSLRLAGADSTIADLQQWRGEDRTRIDLLTRTLADLRAETKRRASAKFLGFLPPWTDEAVMVLTAAKIGYEIGKGS